MILRAIRGDEVEALLPFLSSHFDHLADVFLVRPDKILSAGIDAANYGYFKVAEEDGEIVGFLAANVAELPFFDRLVASISGFRSYNGKAGNALMKDFIEWFNGEQFIKVAVWQNDTQDERIDKFMARHGFTPTTGYSLIKG